MKLIGVTPVFLFAFLYAPLSLRAQTDPNAMPPGSQPSSPGAASHASAPGTVSGSTLSAQDSSMNGGTVDASHMKDKMFLRKVSEGGMAQVQLGQLASQKAGSSDVKKLGQKMVDDHTVLNSELGPLAEEMGLKLSGRMNKMDQAEYDKLSGLSGTEFDKEYLAFLTQDHRNDLREFKREEASTTDPAVKDAVTQGEKMIAGHLRIIEKLDAANGVRTASAPE